ncbi:MAG: hypothetical protein M1835_006287 [Candelina submexicana]|nr:MAG: hypothetical protein M1835_006287 [Candelina submexicana]
MDRSTEQALSGLVPTLSILPQELIELATSLLAQSRTRASNLKAEEEIARSYACANIACERLKQSLNLPKIEPRPPCPPRVYKKLYQYLERTLPARSQAPVRALKASAAARSTPTSSPAKLRTPSKQTPQKPITPRRKGIQHGASTIEIPAWIMPTVRKLCVALGAPAAPAHVLAGVTSILTLPAPSEDGKRTAVSGRRTEKIPALIVAVLFYVMTRLSGEEISAEEYPKGREAAIKALEQIGSGREEREKINNEDVDDWTREISAGGWIKLDWFENITQGAGLGLPGNDMGKEHEEEGEEDAVQARTPKRNRLSAISPAKMDTLQSGPGTMMQDKYDYLSEARRMDYLEWKKGILFRIEQMEREQAIDAS